MESSQKSNQEKQNGLQLNNQSGSSLQISKAVGEILKEIQDVNAIVPFQRSIPDLIRWAQIIDEEEPGLPLAKLKCVMAAFKTDLLEFDRHQGVQNIFRGLKKVKETNTGHWYVDKLIY